MALKSKFLCSNLMEAAIVVSATSSATGYAKENLLGHNLDIPWKPTSTAQQDVIIDLGAIKNVKCISFFIKNYTTSFSGSELRIAVGTDGIVFATVLDGITVAPPSDNPIWVLSPTGFDVTNRYWRFRFLSMPAVIEISSIIMGVRTELNRAEELPIDVPGKYFNNRTEGPGGRTFVTSVSSRRVDTFTRTYQLNGTADIAVLQALHDNSRGGALPFVIADDDDDTDAKLVRMVKDEFSPKLVGYQRNNPTITFETLQYTPAGALY